MGHLWNLICLEDQWYTVDVTWGDTDDERIINQAKYTTFNLGLDLSSRMYDVDAANMREKIAPYTDQYFFFNVQEPGFGQTVETITGLALAACSSYRRGETKCWIRVANGADHFDWNYYQTAMEKACGTSPSTKDLGWFALRWTDDNDIYVYHEWH